MFRQQMASEQVSSSQFPSKQIDGGFWSFRSKIFPRIFSRQKSTSRHLLPCALVRKAHRLWAETGENSVKWRGGKVSFLCALSFLALLLNLTSKLRHANSRKNHVSIRQKLTDLEFRWSGIEWWIIYVLILKGKFVVMWDVWFLIKFILWNMYHWILLQVCIFV